MLKHKVTDNAMKNLENKRLHNSFETQVRERFHSEVKVALTDKVKIITN